MSRPVAPAAGAGVTVAAGNGRPSALQLEMARSILEYLYRRGMNAGDHLTEQELVEEFQVSRSPVRGALSYLAERGVVERRPNRGFFVKVNSRELRLDRLDVPKTTEQELLVAITGDWFEKKVPQSFSEAEFRRRYSLGRMTASRILLKLSEDGIITRNRGHGWRFEPTLDTRAAHDDSYAFRMVVEPAAIRSPSFELDRGLAKLCRHDHEMALLKPGQEAPSFSTLADIDAAFHQLIGVSSRNRFFLAAIERQISLRRTLEYATRDKARMFDSCLEHMGILDALERDERENAAGLMSRHLATAQDLIAWTDPDDAS